MWILFYPPFFLSSRPIEQLFVKMLNFTSIAQNYLPNNSMISFFLFKKSRFIYNYVHVRWIVKNPGDGKKYKSLRLSAQNDESWNEYSNIREWIDYSEYSNRYLVFEYSVTCVVLYETVWNRSNAPCHITTNEKRNWARKLLVSLQRGLIKSNHSFQNQTLFLKRSFR
jgi:hypothetical protein